MNKRRGLLLTVALLAVLAAIGTGGTLAWLSANEQAANDFTVGLVNIGIVEGGTTLEGGSNSFTAFTSSGQTQAKAVQIKNLNTPAGRAVPAYIRAKVIPIWRGADGNGNGVPVSITLAGTDTAKWTYRAADGYYYYTEPVDPNALTTHLMTGVTLNSAVPAGATLEVQVLADAVQAEGGAALDAWGVDPSTL